MPFQTDIDTDVIYLDSAATVYPKPREVLDTMLELYGRYGVNPGRSGYDLCIVGGDLLEETRERLTTFFGGSHPERLCFAYNASDALNLLILGLVEDHQHVISTTTEHNSVIRPLNHLRRDHGVEVDYLPVDGDGRVDPDHIAGKIGPQTSLVVVNHGSNVIGAVQPLAEIGGVCREKGVTFIVDCAQTAGVVPIDAEAMCIDALAFTGHKSLLGPTGIGGLWVRDGLEVKQTRAGGTGVDSAYPYHLERYPYRLEIGTPNLMGVVGLYAAQDWIAARGLETIYEHEMTLFRRLQGALQQIEGVHLHGTTQLEHRLPVLSLTVDGFDPSDVGTILDAEYNIACRTGLQCAPLIHEQVGTAPRGTVRLSVGPLNEASHIETAIRGVSEIAAMRR